MDKRPKYIFIGMLMLVALGIAAATTYKISDTEVVIPNVTARGNHTFHGNAIFNGTPWVDVRTFGAIPDDDLPDSHGIQAAINSIERGMIYIPSGDYLINESLRYKSNITIKGDGMGKTILYGQDSMLNAATLQTKLRNPPDSGPFNYTYNFVLRDLTIDNKNHTHQVGIQAHHRGVAGMYLVNSGFYNLEIRNTVASCLGIGHLWEVTIDHVVVHSCGSGDPGSNGIGIGTGRIENQSAIVTNSIAYDIYNKGIMLEGQDTLVNHNFVFNDNIAWNCTDGFSFDGVADVTVDGNIAFNNRGQGIFLETNTLGSDYTYDIIISNNIVYDNTQKGLLVDNLESNENTNLVIEGNMFKNNSQANVFINNASSVLFNDNFVYGSLFDGVHFRDVDRITMSGNYIAQNSRNGIKVQAKNRDISEVFIVGNTILNNAWGGVDEGIYFDLDGFNIDTITVSDNRIGNYGGASDQHQGIEFDGDNQGENITNVIITNNNFAGTTTPIVEDLTNIEISDMIYFGNFPTNVEYYIQNKTNFLGGLTIGNGTTQTGITLTDEAGAEKCLKINSTNQITISEGVCA